MTRRRLNLDWQALARSQSAREFLSVYFSSVDRVTGKKISYAEFSRRAGFLSRSFPRDVLMGKRPLSAKAFPKFARALGLGAEWLKLFRYLAALDDPSLIQESMARPALLEQIERLRSRLREPRQRRSQTKQALSTRIMRYPEIPRLYAALGTPAQGASITEIAARTGLDPAAIENILAEMKRWRLVSEIGAGRWKAESFHLALVDLKDDLFFQNLFLSQLEKIKAAAPLNLHSDRALFFTSSLSVNSAQLPEFKKELQELVLGFVDRSEVAEGDSIINIVLGMSP